MDEFKTNPVRLKKVVIAVTVASLATAITAQAEEYSLHFSDPVGDNRPGYFDITGMDFRFDPGTGEYHGRLYAEPTSPFSPSIGFHWYNLALLNLDRQGAGIGFDQLSSYSASGTLVSGTVLEFTGTDNVLTTWLPGQRIAPAQTALAAGSTVFPTIATPYTSAAYFAGAALVVMDPMQIDQAAIIQVPEPRTVPLVGVWLSVIAIYRRICSHGRRLIP